MDNMDISEVTAHENGGEIPAQGFGRPFHGGYGGYGGY
jgi:hypothetical protein